jgi:hypothetical protein
MAIDAFAGENVNHGEHGGHRGKTLKKNSCPVRGGISGLFNPRTGDAARSQ